MAKEKVLLVDDEVEFVEALAERLSARGLQVDTVNSGDDALRAAGRKVYDTIVLDLAMPGMDGMETLEKLRADNPDAQIMLLTGQGDIQTALKAGKLGARDFLEKPTDINELLERIRRARHERLRLEEQRSADEIEAILQRRGW